MEAKKQLRKPENWEDFESLCKKLWGEIWGCKEIKKNGRKGQTQNGVDVYGVPKGENSYHGILCKGKDEYTHKQLSKDEIDREINLAKTFNPPLSKFYFATTANKNSKIEEYIRIKDLENRQKELFEIHLFSWEDIVDLIDENKETHDWYLNLHKFKMNSDVLVCFENDEKELAGSVLFCEKYTHFILGSPASSIYDLYNIKPPDIESRLIGKKNKSYYKFRLKVKNIGNTPIENPKVIIKVSGDYNEIEDENIDTVFIAREAKTDIDINKNQGNFSINPRRNVLALEEEYMSSVICIKPKINGADIELSWKLISNNFKKEGLLKLKISTYLIRKDVDEYVDFRHHVRIEKNIEDYFEDHE